MALSKKDLVIHITLNELYNTHSLITQHIEVLVSILRSIKVMSSLIVSIGPERQATSKDHHG